MYFIVYNRKNWIQDEKNSIMKDLWKKLSKQLDVPPFVIFQDPSLEAMATTYPIT